MGNPRARNTRDRVMQVQSSSPSRPGVHAIYKWSGDQWIHTVPSTTVSMAGKMEAKLAAPALLSLVALTLLAHTLLLHRPRATAWLLSTVDAFGFDGRRLVELVNRRNMILLCNAILLVILKDAGLLAAPARPRSSAAVTARGAACSSSEARPQPKTRRTSTAAGATGDDEGRLEREHRGAETATARVRRRKPLTRAREGEYAATVQEMDPAEKQRSDYSFNHFHHGAGYEIAVVADRISSLHDEGSRGGEHTTRQKAQPEIVDDVDEMNKKFEEFIASMRRKMHLETLQLQQQVEV
ncbi:unnamed protein product [Triticum turgidum subsp. durum]|uniref:Uncharacterized protein n=2 Tax=Triticum TaxID=4564 RepID=A0A9R0Q2Q1_TRITD|nr:unnamed protein product [Triticum turgidum subsp. durum]VAH02542.1 unnamed protein product [Triticum turgidum subsp. durum]